MPFHLAWLYIRIFSIVFSIVRFPIIGFFCGTDDITKSSIILFFTIKGVTSCRSMYIISRNSSRALVVACLYYYCRSQSLFIPDRCYCSNRWYYNRLVDVTFLVLLSRLSFRSFPRLLYVVLSPSFSFCSKIYLHLLIVEGKIRWYLLLVLLENFRFIVKSTNQHHRLHILLGGYA